MRVSVLASGSSGNAILVEGGDTKVLVDAGLAPRRIDQRLVRTGLGVRLEDVGAVLCTHEHGDHAGGVAALASAGLAVYATQGTARALGLDGVTRVASGQACDVGSLRVLPVGVPHDAAEPVAFVISYARGAATVRLGILVDCGHVDDELVRAFAGCDALVLEANHELDLLRNGPYPPALKRRIAGPMGHLSNDQAADFLHLLRQREGEGALPKLVVLAHLSQKNNRPNFARAKVLAALPEPHRSAIFVAPFDRGLAPFVLDPGRFRVLPDGNQRQLSLAFPD